MIEYSKIFWIFLMIQIDKMWLVDVRAVGRFRLGSFRFRRRFFQSKIAAKIRFFQKTWITSKNLSTQGKKFHSWKSQGRKILKIVSTFFLRNCLIFDSNVFSRNRSMIIFNILFNKLYWLRPKQFRLKIFQNGQFLVLTDTTRQRGS